MASPKLTFCVLQARASMIINIMVPYASSRSVYLKHTFLHLMIYGIYLGLCASRESWTRFHETQLRHELLMVKCLMRAMVKSIRVTVQRALWDPLKGLRRFT